MSVQVSLGKQLFNSQSLLQESNARVNELSHLLSETERENKNLKDEMELLNNQLIMIGSQYSQLESTNKIIEENLKNLENKNLCLLENINTLTSSNKDLVSTIKILKIEIENLHFNLEDNKKNNKHFFRELEESEKIKNKFENDLIEVSTVNENLVEKIKIYENVLKQKEKYINILLKKQNGIFKSTDGTENKNTIDTNFNTLDINNENSKKVSALINKKNNSNVNITLLQNKIKEYEEKLNEKDKTIKKIEVEKNNLLTRLRNFSNK